MKILILSDLHQEFGSPFKAPAVDYDVVILAGDIDCPASRAVAWAARPETFPGASAVIYVAGNHEFYGHAMEPLLRNMKTQAQGSFVHALDGDEVVVDGVRFLGCTLWTDFALRVDRPERLVSDPDLSMKLAWHMLNDFRIIFRESPPKETDAPADIGPNTDVEEEAASQVQRGLFSSTGVPSRVGLTTVDREALCVTPALTAEFHQEQRAWLAAKLAEPFDGPTVVVTHHAPHRGSLAAKYADDWVSGAFVSELPEEMFKVPVLWVHGHTHTSFDYQVSNCRVVANPRGYRRHPGKPENEDFDPAFVVEI